MHTCVTQLLLWGSTLSLLTSLHATKNSKTSALFLMLLISRSCWMALLLLLLLLAAAGWQQQANQQQQAVQQGASDLPPGPRTGTTPARVAVARVVAASPMF
jgi:hypothetical protein